MNYENGLTILGGKVYCSNCRQAIHILTILGDTAFMECPRCEREWSRQVTAEHIATLLGDDD